jgi:hypothetical protein
VLAELVALAAAFTAVKAAAFMLLNAESNGDPSNYIV